MAKSLVSVPALKPELLRRRVDPASLPFATTREVSPLTVPIGQPRALDAIEFGLAVQAPGYNLYAAGMPGSGRESIVRDIVARVAATRPTPADWVYVHNFTEPDRPNAISLPAGSGRRLARDMDELLEDMQREIPRAFESEDYERRKTAVVEGVTKRRDALVSELQKFARARDYALEMTPAGIASIPLLNGQPIQTLAFEQLPPEVREMIQRRGQEVQAQVTTTVRQLRQLEKEAAEQARQLEREVVAFVTNPLFAELRERYVAQAEVLAFLERVEEELPAHLHDFWPTGAPEVPSPLAEMQAFQQQEHVGRFRVNVLIDNGQTTGAPVVIEHNPTFGNLIGRIDFRAIFGSMVTDFHQIKPGALHRANGGFLVLHVLDLLTNPLTWQALKHALLAGEVRFENPVEQFAIVPTAQLRPEPIPLDVKIVLIGPPQLYQLLYGLDEDFPGLFAVKADFAPDITWNDESVGHYAAFIKRRINECGLQEFDRTAVAQVVEYGARLRDHQKKLSTRLLDISNLLTEADYWAKKSGHEVVQAVDVDQAQSSKVYRANLIEERLQEVIADGTIMIDTSGERVGQVNGLAVLDLGDYMFGRPSRVTARVSLGKGTIQSIEREIELSGPIHSKGFLILAGYLSGQYAQEWPLALAATLTFEQSYDEIEGDSASSTELYALLSALSGLPLKQSIAVTGAVNQHGEVQAVGGVTRKIEGFFAVCKAKGLTGEQGVIIPATNVQHLMLEDEVVEAVRAGKFNIWAVHHVDEGIALLTGHAAGQRTAAGVFPADSVHHLVEQRLRHYAEQIRDFSIQADGSGTAKPARVGRKAKTDRRRAIGLPNPR